MITVLIAVLSFAFGAFVGRATKRPVVVEKRVIPISVGNNTFKIPKEGATFRIEAWGGGGGGGRNSTDKKG